MKLETFLNDIEAGCQDYLTKPINEEILIMKINAWITRN